MKPTNFWITDRGQIITDPAAQGYVETDCGPDMLTKGECDYCERILAFRACFVAVDGSFKKPANSIEALKKIIADRGCANESGVSDDGIVRFDGVQYRTSKTWFNFSLATLKCY